MPVQIPSSARTDDGRVRVLTAGGVLRVVDPGKVQGIIDSGGRFPTGTAIIEETRRQHREAEFGGTAETIRTFGEGALDMVIPGVSGFLSEDAGTRAQVNPVARGAGSIAGLGLGLLSTGATGAGRLAGGVTGGALQLGNKIAAGGTSAASIVGRNVVAGAIEGGLFGAAGELTNASITDKPLTGESLGSAILGGSLAGGAFGVIPGGVQAFRAHKAAKAEAFALRQKVFRDTLDDYAAGLKPQTAEAKAAKRVFEGEYPNYSPMVDRPKWQRGMDWDELKSTVRARDAARDPVKAAAAEATQEVNKTYKAFKSALGIKEGDITGQDLLRGLRGKNAKKIVKTWKAYDDYVTAASKNLDGDDLLAFEAKQEQFKQAILNYAEDTLGKVPETSPSILLDLAAAAGLEAVDDQFGPLGEVASTAMQVALGESIFRSVTGKGGKGFIAQALSNFMGRGTEGGVRGLMGSRVPRGVQYGAGAVANIAARKATNQVVSGNIGNAVKAQLSAQGRIGRAIRTVGKAYRPGVAFTAYDAVKGILNPDERKEVSEAKGDGQKFLAQMKALRKLNGNPQELERRSWELSAPYAIIDPELGQLVQQDIQKRIQFLAQKLPQNPGNMRTFTGDRWVPNPLEMAKWARYAKAAIDPASVVEQMSSGRLTPEAAEALKALDPNHFAEMQRRLLENPESIDKIESDFGLRVNMGLLFDVSTDPTISILPQLQNNHRAMEAQQQEQMQSGPTPQAPSTGLNQPTNAQKLENR